jgi:hypothetical protein
MGGSSGVGRGAGLPVAGRGVAGVRGDLGDVVVVPGKGLQFTRRLPFDRWVSVGRRLSDVYTSSAWCLGDWLVYGERAYGGRYREAIEQTSLDYQTLRNYAWVVKRFSLSRRRDALSFGHHAEVAALPAAEQDFWLRKAEELGWSVKQLRREVRTSLGERSADEGPAGNYGDRGQADRPGPLGRAADSRVCLTIELTAEQWEAFQALAAGAGLSMDAWAVAALDQAARRLADPGLEAAGPGEQRSGLGHWLARS